MSNRSEIIEYVQARLETIDEDTPLYLGEIPTLGEDDPDQALALVLGEDESRWQGEQIVLTLPLHVHALAKADLDEPWSAVETSLAAIKTAVEESDRRMGRRLCAPLARGSTRTLAREPGSTTVGLVITYYAMYTEVWGNP